MPEEMPENIKTREETIPEEITPEVTPEVMVPEEMIPEDRLTKRQRTILDAILFLFRKGELPTVREVGALVGLRSPATVLKHLRVLERLSLISLSGKSRGIRIADPELLERVIQDTAGDLEWAIASEDAPSPKGDSEAAMPLDEVLRAHVRGLSRLTSVRSAWHRFSARGMRRIPLVGAIAAGHPFESYSEGYEGGELGPGDFGLDDFGIDELSSPTATAGPPVNSPTLGIDPRAFCESGDVLALKVEGDSMVNAGILHGDYAIIRRQNTVEEGEIAAVIINGEGTLKRWRTRSASRADGGGAHRRRSVSLEPENDDFAPIEITEEEGKDILVIGKYVGLVRGVQPLL